jgi:hypothetical protein
MNNTYKNLDPNWITGFTDAEGCFYINIYKSKNSKNNWGVCASFGIMLHIKDKDILLNIKSFFDGIGNIHYSKNVCVYRVNKLQDIINLIIPHFDKYSLITQKQSDFLLFKEIVYLMLNKEHLNKNGLLKILNLKASLNRGIPESLSYLFPDIIKVKKPCVNITKNINNNWLAGFFSGEGCFKIDISKSNTCKTGYAIRLHITIVQHIKDEILMNNIKNSLSLGSIYKYPYENTIRLEIFKFEDIYFKMIPLFKKYNIQGVKALNFQDFCEAAELINNKIHITAEGLEKVRLIKSRMNINRYLYIKQ